MKYLRGFKGHSKVFACIGIVALLLVGTCFAYWSASLQHKNELRADQVTGFIQETFQEGSEPEGTVAKVVSFQNTGTAAAFLRIAAVESWSKVEDGKTILLSNKAGGADVATKNWTSSFQSTSLWEEGSDGWYYYKKLLKPEESTAAILSSVSFPAYTGDYEDYRNADYNLYFRMELLQASDSKFTMNTSQVNEEASQSVFGRTASVDDHGAVTWQ